MVFFYVWIPVFREELFKIISWFCSKIAGLIRLDLTDIFGGAFCILLVILFVIALLGKWIIKYKEYLEKWITGKK